MSQSISEPDWKVFQELRPIALERFCQRVLAEIDRLGSDADRTYHERYLAVFTLIQQRDEALATSFDAPRRSTALLQLAHLLSQRLLTEEEASRFSPETRARVRAIVGGESA